MQTNDLLYTGYIHNTTHWKIEVQMSMQAIMNIYIQVIFASMHTMEQQMVLQ